VVFITVATSHTRTANFWADFEQHNRQGNKRAAERSWPKDCTSNTCKHYLFNRFNFSVHKAASTVWNDAY